MLAHRMTRPVTRRLMPWALSLYQPLIDERVERLRETRDDKNEIRADAFRAFIWLLLGTPIAKWRERITPGYAKKSVLSAQIDLATKKKALPSNDEDGIQRIEAPSDYDPVEIAVRQEEHLLVNEGLRRLRASKNGAAYARILHLRYFEKLKWEEIGKVMRLSRGTARLMAEQAHEFLAKDLVPKFRDSDIHRSAKSRRGNAKEAAQLPKSRARIPTPRPFERTNLDSAGGCSQGGSPSG